MSTITLKSFAQIVGLIWIPFNTCPLVLPLTLNYLFFGGWKCFSTVTHSPPAHPIASGSWIYPSLTKSSMCCLLVSNDYLAARIKLSMVPGKIQISTQQGHFHLSNITTYSVQTKKLWVSPAGAANNNRWSQEIHQTEAPTINQACVSWSTTAQATGYPYSGEFHFLGKDKVDRSASAASIIYWAPTI